jgi:hypothetical protein
MHPAILIGQNNQPVRFEGLVAPVGLYTSWRTGEWAYADVVQRKDDNSPGDQDLTNLIKVGLQAIGLGSQPARREALA